jgi:hypothetical protein
MIEDLHPIMIVMSERAAQRQLCVELEQIADQLPKIIDQRALDKEYQTLKTKLPIYQHNEEVLYSFISTQIPERGNWSELIQLTKKEHSVQQDYANELQSFLGEDFTCRDMNCLGYMLRYFFETILLHLDWEDVTIMALAAELEPKVDWNSVSGKLIIDQANFTLQ